MPQDLITITIKIEIFIRTSLINAKR